MGYFNDLKNEMCPVNYAKMFLLEQCCPIDNGDGCTTL